jgi:triacylglycerol lipase
MATRDDLITGATSAIAADPFAVSYLQLCQISYFLPITNIAPSVATMPPLAGASNGQWKCVWGPATNGSQANLAYVAAYYDNATNLPVAAVVCLRGTDFYVSDWGIVEQVWQDLDVTSQVPMPWDPNNPARIANGTADAIAEIDGLRSNGQSLIAFLATFLSNPANQRPVLIVTGHSLGGCLTSVVAPWLKTTLAAQGVRAPVVPCAFAGPTAGNKAFANYFDSQFSYSLRYHNTLDVVPHAWQNLAGIETIYDAWGLTIPDPPYAAILGFRAMMYAARVSYVQPTMNSELKGQFTTGLDWYGELELQHHTTTYMTLLGGTSIIPPLNTLQPSTRATTTRLHDRLGSTSDALAKAAASSPT